MTQFGGLGWIHPLGSTYWIVHGRRYDPVYSRNKGGQGEAAWTVNPPKFSWNQISKKYGLSPSTVSKRMTGKVVGMGPQVGGVRRGRIFQAG